MHPLVEDLSKFKDAEIESKIQELSKKYWLARNPDLQFQISMVLDVYREELGIRQQRLLQQLHQNRDKDLDKLIKVN